MERLTELEGLVKDLTTQISSMKKSLPDDASRALYTSTNSADFSAGDTAWVMTSTALILMMTMPGLALFYSGMVRTKNVLAVLMQSFTICCVITFLWVAFGYSLSFSPAMTIDSRGNHDNIFVSFFACSERNHTNC
jgi:uncharacterized protein with PQ loop repeat